MTTTLLLKEDDLSKNTPLGGNVEPSRFIPAIKTAQINFIKPLLGKDLYNKIVQDFKTDSLTGLYLELYTDYIQPMLIHKATAHYFTYGAYQISNKGIYKAGGTDGEGLSKNEVDYMTKAQDSYYENYKRNLFAFLKDNEQAIPEYISEETKRTKRVNFGGWSFKKDKGAHITIPGNGYRDGTFGDVEW